MMANLKHIWQKHRVLIIILLAIIIGGGIGAGYGAWSGAAWKNYQASYEQWHNGIKQRLADAQNLPAKTNEEKAQKLGAYKQIAAEVAEQKAQCEPPQLAKWQAPQKENVARTETCAKLNERTQVFTEALNNVVSYLEAEEALATVLSKAQGEAKLTEKTWPKQVEVWQAASEGVAKLPESTAFTPVKKVAAKQVSAVLDAWKEIIAANKAKDEAAFVKAEASLESAYENLAAIPDESSEQLRRLQETLDSKHKEAF